MTILHDLPADRIPRRRALEIDAATRDVAAGIVDDVRARGDAALREHAERLGDVVSGGPLALGPDEMNRALETLPSEDVAVLRRTAQRIRRFAEAQRSSLGELDVAIEGGRAGHALLPVASAGCYAPGGRFPLPSSVLMTALTARVAGVERVVVASPRPAPATLAAAALTGADEVLAVGGAQAIAALAYGTEAMAPVDFVCGPGNRYVTAAKREVFGEVGIDSLAGPSELVVLADSSADPSLVAADLLSQAEHDEDAWPVLVSTDAELPNAVRAELEAQLATLPPGCARTALERGFTTVVADLEQACAICDGLAPEHLALFVAEPRAVAERCVNAGAVFLGPCSSEVLGDYGAGPNHVLPTVGGGRYRGGLSVLDFLRVRTWLEVDNGEDAELIARDAAHLARMEGLEAHARAAGIRCQTRC